MEYSNKQYTYIYGMGGGANSTGKLHSNQHHVYSTTYQVKLLDIIGHNINHMTNSEVANRNLTQNKHLRKKYKL